MCCRKSIAKPAWRASLKKLESRAMLKEKAHSMTCLFAASIIGAWWKGHVIPTGVTPVGMTCPFHQAPMIEAANRHVMEWAFSFNIARDSSFFNDARHAGFAIDFLQHI